MTSCYGFVVMAWLIVSSSTTNTPVAFPSMEACQKAEAVLEDGRHAGNRVHCVATGAQPVSPTTPKK